MLPKERFVLETEEYRSPDQSKNTWSELRCKVMEVQPNGSRAQIGEYIRNYSILYSTWEPFEQNGKFFALCSTDYTATAVMALPECKIIASETPHGFGFCPTGFFVPTEMKSYINDDEPEPLPKEWCGKFGFVCGCIWGDDTSWKVQFLDLSEITNGKIVRDERLGYVELPGSDQELDKYVFVGHSTNEFSERLVIRIAHEKRWSGGLKWTGKASEEVEDDELDLNTMADEMTNHVLKDIKYSIKNKNVPGELQTAEFREDIRNTMISYLGRLAGGDL